MGRSHKGVKWDRPFVVSGMLKSHKNFHDCCQCEIEGFVSFWNAEAKTQNSPPSGGNLRRVEGAPLPQTSFVATSCPAARWSSISGQSTQRGFFCQHPKMPHFSNGGTSFFKKMSWSSKDDNHPMIPSLFKSKVIEVFVRLDNVKGQRVRFELRPPPNCTELSQQYLPGEGL